MKCTWIDCEGEACHPQIVKADGEVWANLCDTHHQEMEKAIDELNAKSLLRCWILAQGGSKRAAERTLGRSIK